MGIAHATGDVVVINNCTLSVHDLSRTRSSLTDLGLLFFFWVPGSLRPTGVGACTLAFRCEQAGHDAMVHHEPVTDMETYKVFRREVLQNITLK